MKKYKTMFSFSFRSYGDNAGVWHDGRKTPICMGTGFSHTEISIYCLSLAAYLLEMAHDYEHADDFVIPVFDKEHREAQLEKLRALMMPVFEKND